MLFALTANSASCYRVSLRVRTYVRTRTRTRTRTRSVVQS